LGRGERGKGGREGGRRVETTTLLVHRVRLKGGREGGREDFGFLTMLISGIV